MISEIGNINNELEEIKVEHEENQELAQVVKGLIELKEYGTQKLVEQSL